MWDSYWGNTVDLGGKSFSLLGEAKQQFHLTCMYQWTHCTSIVLKKSVTTQKMQFVSSIQKQFAILPKVTYFNRKSVTTNIRLLTMMKHKCHCSSEQNNDHVEDNVTCSVTCIWSCVNFLPDKWYCIQGAMILSCWLASDYFAFKWYINVNEIPTTNHFAFNVLSTVHHSISVQWNQRDAPFIQFIKN
jgi:hypothetical protein